MVINLGNLERETKELLKYIDAKWGDLTGNAKTGLRLTRQDLRERGRGSADGHSGDADHDRPQILFLPHDFVYPGGRFIVQFYWDSYFIVLSLLRSDRIGLAKGIVDSCLYLIENYGMVIANRVRWAAGSQLPFLSDMVKEVYAAAPDRTWLAGAVRLLEAEYEGYWTNSYHLLPGGLSRYHAPDYFPEDSIAAITLDHEATWDLSPRFEKETVLQIAPVDLNCNLNRYENDLSHFHDILGNGDRSRRWASRAKDRGEKIRSLMWNENEGLFLDYNAIERKQTSIRSLATLFPLYCEIATPPQARAVRDNLSRFEQSHGLSACDQDYGYHDRQWNYPVGWPPLHWIAHVALMNYGMQDDARRIALKWLGLNLRVWKETGKLYEKYNVVDGSLSVLDDRYKNQEGFGWTNAIFHLLSAELRP